jgi:chromosome segregation protein
MVLRKLTVSGFKSFANKIEVDFDKGVTGIIGPNGCGKSNVSDAIRWVLGEQNPRRLRGTGMLDMIFNGTVSRAAEGIAEVSLLFDNTENILPVSYREVQITRRLYRSGESEYLLNKTKCRLKDITDLFLDSGIGTSSYSLMEQGRVDMIVNAKPTERRLILEEAAGVSRFLNRKNEALRKLDRTEQDLTRIIDILSELQRQRRSLERQARQANLARKYRTDLLQVDYTLHMRSGSKLISNLEERDAKLKGLGVRIQALEGEIGEVRNRKRALNERLEEQDEFNRKQRDTWASSNAHLEQTEAQLKNLTERLAEYNQLKTRLLQECEQDTQRCTEEREGIVFTEQQIERLTHEAEELQSVIEEITQEQTRIARAFADVESESEKRRKVFLNLEQEITEHRNQQRLWERDKDFYSARLGKLNLEREQICKELASHRIRKDELHKEGETLDRRVKEMRQQFEHVTALLKELQRNEAESRSAYQQCERQWQQAHSRWESLTQLQANLAGFDEGVRFLLRDEKGRMPNLVCTLAEKVKVDAGYERAIDAALSRKLQAVVAEDGHVVKEAVTKLREQKKGRVAFLPLHRNSGAAQSAEPAALASLKKAHAVVHCDEALHPLVQRLLTGVYVVETLDQAMQLQTQLPCGYRIVTAEGDVVEGDGTVIGGYSAGSQILSRAAEITQLETQVNELTQERAELEERTQQLREEINLKSSEKDSLRQTLLEKENRQRVVRDEYDRVSQRLGRMEDSEKTLDSECQDLLANLEKGAEEAEIRAAQLDVLSERRNEMEIEINNWTEQIQQARDNRRTIAEKLSDQRMRLLEKQKDREHHTASIQTAQRHLQELERGISEKRRLAEQQDQRRTETEKEIELAKVKIDEHRTERDSVWKEVQQGEEITQGIRSELKKIDLEDSSLQDKFEALRKEQGILDQERMKLQVENEYWQRKLDAEFQALEEKEECEKDERSDDDLLEKQDFYRRRLSQLGIVNELAIEEYEEVKERCDFLEAQKKDLEKSRTNLLATAKELHGTTIDLFLETFEKVKDNFNRAFRRMFNGGRAELVLLEGDPMEAGIDIVVQPPGKKLQSITLLSGGEKALVAIALLFAIYEIKPCPFCFLDEIDAPLDDTNIGRFTTMLRDFLDHSQFIIITHSKKTMEICDAIYGVTMAQEGISSLYSMKFKKHEGKQTENPSQAQKRAIFLKTEEEADEREPVGVQEGYVIDSGDI